MVDDVADQVGSRMQTKFVEESAFVSADGLDAQVEFGGYLAGALASRKRQHDSVFPGGEGGTCGRGFRNCSGRGQVSKVLLAGEHALDGSEEIGAAGILAYVNRPTPVSIAASRSSRRPNRGR